MDNSSTLPVGKPADMLVWEPRDGLFDDLLALASYDHVNVRATVKQVLHLLCRLVAPDDCTHLMRQLSDEITDLLEARVPLDADA